MITLGIIGVVAALVMPSLLTNTLDKELDSRYKKAKNILTNGYNLMMVKEEVNNPSDLEFMSHCNDDVSCISKLHSKIFNISQDNINPAILPNEYSASDSNDDSGFNWLNVPYIFTTPDGFVYGLIIDNDHQSFSVVTDVNNLKNPNKVKRDLYKFRMIGNIMYDVSEELIEKEEECIFEPGFEAAATDKHLFDACAVKFYEDGKCIYRKGCG